MLKEKLKNYHIILASGSPRRHHFFKELDVDFTIDVREVEEVYPSHLKASEITDYLAQLKASVFKDISEKDIIITSDTIVWKDHEAIGKPKDFDDAVQMLQHLSGNMHEVYTSVCFTSKDFQITVNDCTKVWFNEFTLEEIKYYLNTCKPFDKAGSYGIQDWLGYMGVEKLEGCFFNVMGLPTRLVYKTLMGIANR
ncbi:Maf family nucleotide pyrophosphatase [Aureisphaera sp. CAU 1614]|uniref:dTTP/UTP pyrophosphatase n=1 Tax=Halomarinibacterium sedimenti TaxID=2857106 RepID=A0A9X1JV59_9FLAO|nr:Maf family nucleotide pyrophosphatase [Halomarinibacterium sedimenti]MBW2937624.1 Maf family nucleotide pyrophosphatase [Halomarinibacterium sedimenti]